MCGFFLYKSNTYILNAIKTHERVVTIKLMLSYSFTRVNDEFYEGRGHKFRPGRMADAIH